MRFPIQPETIVPNAMQTSKAVTFFITSRLLSFVALAALTVLISLSKFSDASGFKLYFTIKRRPTGPPTITALINPNVAAAAPTRGAAVYPISANVLP